MTGAPIPVGPDAASAYNTLGAGVVVYVDENGEIQQIPDTGTPPLGEPDLYVDTGVPGQVPVEPPINQQATDDLLHEQIHGVPWHGYDIEEWVNPENPGIPNLGPINVQDFQSGQTSNVKHVQSSEQGWGLDPAVINARYPKVVGTNPYYSYGIYRRNGELQFDVSGIPFGEVSQQAVEMQYAERKRVSTVHGKLQDLAASVPYSSTVVPVAGQAGPLSLIPDEAEGFYPAQ